MTRRARPDHPVNRWLALCVVIAAAVIMPCAASAQSESAPAAGTTPADAPKRVVIRFLTDSDYPPFNFLDEDGVLVGFNVDLARAICLELNTPCDVKARPWGELFLSLKRGDADAVIAGHKVTAEAVASVDFTDRYFYTPGRFAASRKAEDIDVGPDGFDGQKIAVAKGTPHEAYLRAFFRDSPLQVFETPELAREALAAGKADYVFDDGISLAFWLNGTLSGGCCEFRGGPFIEPKFFGDGIAIAVAKKDHDLKGQINGALKRVKTSGRLEELVQRYFPLRIY